MFFMLINLWFATNKKTTNNTLYAARKFVNLFWMFNERTGRIYINTPRSFVKASVIEIVSMILPL
jgi:hypothetical protein